MHDFRLRGPGVNKVLSSVPAVGTKTATVRLCGRPLPVRPASRMRARMRGAFSGHPRTMTKLSRLLLVLMLAGVAALGGALATFYSLAVYRQEPFTGSATQASIRAPAGSKSRSASGRSRPRHGRSGPAGSRS